MVKLGNQQYIILQPFLPVMYRISTSLADELGETLFSRGLEAFLALETQQLKEHPVGIDSLSYGFFIDPDYNPDHINFTGAFGTYYRELFFHIPFLIASHCNANQKFKEAKWWYERIFDPTAPESPDDERPTDRNWRYIEFRDLTIQTVQDILTDEAAIAQYKADPFNPHAIARLRLSVYQKAIVMKYIDNLLDWGDYLFAQDTRESIVEATRLYILAQDILGKRPVQMGNCETAPEAELTYENIGPKIEEGSEILIFLENWNGSHSTATEASTRGRGAESATNAARALASGTSERRARESGASARLTPYQQATKSRKDYTERITKAETAGSPQRSPHLDQVMQSLLAFCVPPNDELLKYWDRVEDRLFKIRHCMNISGVRRELALFQPPLDVMALVKAKAAGLSLEDILAMVVEPPLPHYRFMYLLEKAKQFTQTVQSFGNALLSALEKKDVEELTRLRSVHEREILRMTKEIKKQQVKEAQHQYLATVESKTNVENRVKYYQGLIEEGLTGWEITQQISKHTATGLVIAKGVLDLVAGILYTIPQIGSPCAMKYGGKEVGDSTANFADWLGRFSIFG